MTMYQSVKNAQDIVRNPFWFANYLPFPSTAKTSIRSFGKTLLPSDPPSTFGTVIRSYYSVKYKSQILVLSSGRKFNVREGRLY